MKLAKKLFVIVDVSDTACLAEPYVYESMVSALKARRQFLNEEPDLDPSIYIVAPVDDAVAGIYDSLTFEYD